MKTLLLLLVTAVVVLLADWPWHSMRARVAGASLRVLLAVVLALMMGMNLDIGPAWRRALVADNPVTSAQPAFPVFTPYESGVTTMRREVERDLAGTTAPLLSLVWLGVSPLFRPSFRRRKVP